MKKSEPKIILNVSFENEELEQKVSIAMDQYLEKVIYKSLDSAIEKAVNERINFLLNGSRWDVRSKIQGVTLAEYVNTKTESVIADIIEKNAKQILAKKLAMLI